MTGQEYHGQGFSGRPMGVGPQPALAPKAETAERPQPSPPVMYCHSCQRQAEWLPNGQLWCSRCKASVVVGASNLVAERLQGFAIGFLFSIIGVVGVALFSDPAKQGNRLVGAIGGMVFWVGLLWFLGAFDPWLAQYGLNARDCYPLYDGITCTGPWSPQ